MAVEDRIPKELKSFPVGLCAPVGGAPAYQAAAWLHGPGAHANFIKFVFGFDTDAP